ncbi:hypothetical protein FRX31_010389 [Thalictrum thalictroides]|uniref:DUF7787 domain-containing protein n=1 Tax=Thalictrum thalictroides TaxID=46969 RepID=A0A7J6WRM1_THATH|nr:hypothetical protein FRX31_010389 [Thalictrum thalictroides]
MKGNGKALALEDYIEFLENPHGHDLTNSHLNQIISMHGFKKMHHSQKVELVDALNTMDLLYPNRSTLKQNISSSDAANLLSTEEVIKDLDLLDWKECTLRSIETINSSGWVEMTTRFSSTPTPTRHNHRDVRGQYSDKDNGGGGGVNKTGQRSGKRKKRSLTALSFAAPATVVPPPAGSAS